MHMKIAEKATDTRALIHLSGEEDRQTKPTKQKAFKQRVRYSTSLATECSGKSETQAFESRVGTGARVSNSPHQSLRVP